MQGEKIKRHGMIQRQYDDILDSVMIELYCHLVVECQGVDDVLCELFLCEDALCSAGLSYLDSE